MSAASKTSQRGAIRAATLFGLVLLAVVILATILWFAGRRQGHADVLTAVPKDAATLIYVPHTQALVADLRAAARSLRVERRLQGYESALTRQLGFDPADPKALADHGLDPEGGIAVFTLPLGKMGVAAVKVTDRDRFEKTALTLLADRADARPGPTRDVSGIPVKTAITADGRLALAWAFREDVAILSGGDESAPDRVATAVARRGGTSLLDDPWFSRSRAHVGESPSLLLWSSAAGAARLGQDTAGFPAGALALDVSQTRVALRAFVGFDETRRALLGALRQPENAGGLVADLDPKALLAARASADLPALWKTLKAQGLPRRLDDLSARLLAAGVKVEKDVLPLLTGTALLDLRLAPSPDLSTMASLDPRRTNPFQYVRAAVFVPVRDGKKAAALLPALASALGPTLHAQVEPTEVEGQPAWTVRYHLGEGMTFGLHRDVLVLAGGEGAYRDALRRLADHGEGAFGTEAMRKTLADDGSLALALDVRALLSTVRGLPAEAFGGGPNGIVVRSMVGRFASALDPVTGVVGTLTPDGDGLSARLEVGFTPPPEPAR